MKRRLFAPLVDTETREILLSIEWLLVPVLGPFILGFFFVTAMAVLP